MNKSKRDKRGVDIKKILAYVIIPAFVITFLFCLINFILYTKTSTKAVDKQLAGKIYDSLIEAEYDKIDTKGIEILASIGNISETFVQESGEDSIKYYQFTRKNCEPDSPIYYYNGKYTSFNIKTKEGGDCYPELSVDLYVKALTLDFLNILNDMKEDLNKAYKDYELECAEVSNGYKFIFILDSRNFVINVSNKDESYKIENIAEYSNKELVWCTDKINVTDDLKINIPDGLEELVK